MFLLSRTEGTVGSSRGTVGSPGPVRTGRERCQVIGSATRVPAQQHKDIGVDGSPGQEGEEREKGSDKQAGMRRGQSWSS